MAIPILWEQMQHVKNSGLLDAASEFHVGVNGGEESRPAADSVFPKTAKLIYHGLDCKAENLTIVALHEWAMKHPGWNILYAHGKGATHWPGTHYGENVARPWRLGMMNDLVTHWRTCVADLETNDVACMVWLWSQGWDLSQHIPAGNFLWTTSDFVAKLPSLCERARIKEDGIGAVTARFEAEVFWGNGPRPKVKAYRDRLPF
jgi:hypothetical protein